MYIAECN